MVEVVDDVVSAAVVGGATVSTVVGAGVSDVQAHSNKAKERSRNFTAEMVPPSEAHTWRRTVSVTAQVPEENSDNNQGTGPGSRHLDGVRPL